MPIRAPRICSCGKVVPSGQRCACQARRAQEREAARPTARQRGYSSRWDRESKAFLALPGNERCACGCGRPANVVDHHKAHKGDQALFWDRSNWRPMNIACNSRKAVRVEGGFGRPIRDGELEHGIPAAVPNARLDSPAGSSVDGNGQ